jgi:type I restriction enzyme S subunit
MMRFRANSSIVNKFLYFVLSREETRNYLRDRATGTAGNMPKINQPTLMSVPIPLASLPEQHEIVRRVEKLFALADRIEARFAEGRKRVDGITQAILAKAFRGELVPTEFELAKAEGRSFESAEELLNRIGRNGHKSGETQKVKPRLHGSKSI